MKEQKDFKEENVNESMSKKRHKRKSKPYIDALGLIILIAGIFMMVFSKAGSTFSTGIVIGVVGRVKPIEGINPNPAGSISVAGGGSVMSSFLQKEEYYSGRDLYYLVPKIKLNDKELLFYCLCLRANAFRYSYGRQANKTLKEIENTCKRRNTKMGI